VALPPLPPLESEMTESVPNAPVGWPKVEFEDLRGHIQTAGWIHPLNKKLLPKARTRKARLFGLAVRLEWHSDDVSGLLASSEQDAETIIHAADGVRRGS
jgi:hypothetical protein